MSIASYLEEIDDEEPNGEEEGILEEYVSSAPQYSPKEAQKAPQIVYDPEEEIEEGEEDFFQILEEQGIELPPYILNPAISGKEAARHAARSAARVGEAGLGLLGDINQNAQKLQRIGLLWGAEKLGVKEPVEKILDIAQKYSPSQLLPTSQRIREDITERFSGDYLKPQSEKEQQADDFIQDVTALSIPLGGIQSPSFLNTLTRIGRSILTALTGKAAEKTAESLGAKEKGQNAAKLGGMVLAEFINPRGVKRYINGLYDTYRNMMSPQMRVGAQGLIRRLNEVERTLNRGPSTPGTRAVQSTLDEIRQEVQQGSISLEYLDTARERINELRQTLFDQFPSATERAGAKRYYNDLSRAIDETIEVYGQQHNPQFLSAYRAANEAYAANARSKAISSFIGDVIKQHKLGSMGGLAALAYGVGKGVVSSVAAKGLAGGAAALKTGEFIARIWPNTALRNYYLGALRGAAIKNSQMVARNLEKLHKGLKKEGINLEDYLGGSGIPEEKESE